jgi:hypothetical protein
MSSSAGAQAHMAAPPAVVRASVASQQRVTVADGRSVAVPDAAGAADADGCRGSSSVSAGAADDGDGFTF